MRTIQGDLIALAKQGAVDVVAHGCNCMCQMGAGIARTIKHEFPQAYEADCRTRKGDRTKLGTCTWADFETEHGHLIIVNAYTQYDYRGQGVLVDYDAVRNCLRWIAARCGGKRIGLPRIGAGLARGDWDVIRKIIEEELGHMDVTIVEFIEKK